MNDDKNENINLDIFKDIGANNEGVIQGTNMDVLENSEIYTNPNKNIVEKLPPNSRHKKIFLGLIIFIIIGAILVTIVLCLNQKLVPVNDDKGIINSYINASMKFDVKTLYELEDYYYELVGLDHLYEKYEKESKAVKDLLEKNGTKIESIKISKEKQYKNDEITNLEIRSLNNLKKEDIEALSIYYLKKNYQFKDGKTKEVKEIVSVANIQNKWHFMPLNLISEEKADNSSESTMESAKMEVFGNTINRIIHDTRNLHQTNSVSTIHNPGVYIYDIKMDLDYRGLDKYKGYIVADDSNLDNPKYIAYLHDEDFYISGFTVTNSYDYPETMELRHYDFGKYNPIDYGEKEICSLYGKSICYNSKGESIIVDK